MTQRTPAFWTAVGVIAALCLFRYAANDRPAEAAPSFNVGEGSTVVPVSLSASVTSVFSVPSGARRLWTGVHLINVNTSACWVQWFDAASATLGTTVPRWSIYVPPANGSFLGSYDYGFSNVETPFFSIGMIAFATTTPTGNVGCTSPITGAISYR